MSRYTVTNISSISWKLSCSRYQYRWTLKSSENPRGLRTPTKIACLKSFDLIKDFITRNVWKASSSCSLFDIFCWNLSEMLLGTGICTYIYHVNLCIGTYIPYTLQSISVWFPHHPHGFWHRKIPEANDGHAAPIHRTEMLHSKESQAGKPATEGPCHGNLPPETWHTPAWPHGRLWVLIWPLWRKGLPLVWLGLFLSVLGRKWGKSSFLLGWFLSQRQLN